MNSPDRDWAEIGRRIEDARGCRDVPLSRDDVVELMRAKGVAFSAQRLAELERGDTRHVSLRDLTCVCRVLGKRLSWVLDGEEPEDG